MVQHVQAAAGGAPTLALLELHQERYYSPYSGRVELTGEAWADIVATNARHVLVCPVRPACACAYAPCVHRVQCGVL